jgi:predicted acylesterase/phospholipase RssA
MSQKIKLRVVFQGGGARLVNLLAVMEVLQDLEGKDIQITRVAGTSAGGITAALLANGVKAQDFKAFLIRDGQNLLQRCPRPSALGIAWKLLTGKSLWNINVLRDLLKTHLKEGLKFSELKLPLALMAADLQERQPKIYSTDKHGEETVLKAVMDSAAVPIAFRCWNRQDGALHVDGGICENLPIEQIGGSEDKDGPVVAFGFDKPPGPAPTGLKEFGMALLDVVLNHNERRARQLLPAGRVLLLPAVISTFDFPTAFGKGLNSDYDEVKGKVARFLSDFCKTERQSAATIAAGMDAWSHSDRIAREIMEGIGEVYMAQHANRKIRYTEAKYEIKAYSLTDSERNDETEIETIFYTIDEPVYCLGFAIDRPPGSRFTGIAEIRVTDKSGSPVKIRPLPMIKPEDPKRYRRICVFFENPLPPNTGPYRVRLVDSPAQLMDRLRLRNPDEPDEIAFSLPRSTDPVRIRLVLHIPAGSPIHYRWKQASGYCKGDEMTPLELDQFAAPRNFVTLGWIKKDVPPGSKLGVDVSLVPIGNSNATAS